MQGRRRFSEEFLLNRESSAMVMCLHPVALSSAQKLILHSALRPTSITSQVHDGPPGGNSRRPSSFLLIPVGASRQGFAFSWAPANKNTASNRRDWRSSAG